MTGFEVCTVALLVGGLVPALALASRGTPIARLVGLQIVTAVGVVVLLLLAVTSGHSYELIAPLVLVPLSFAGTLVFTRLIGKSDDGA